MPCYREVHGSCMGDHTHSGPNQAGNKSMLSYRVDKGIPGYTGFNPSSASLLVPFKASAHCGKPVPESVKTLLTAGTISPQRTE
eukprot:gene5826-6111_t